MRPRSIAFILHLCERRVCAVHSTRFEKPLFNELIPRHSGYSLHNFTCQSIHYITVDIGGTKRLFKIVISETIKKLLTRPVGHILKPETRDSSYTDLIGQQIVNGNIFCRPWIGGAKPWNTFAERISTLNFTFIVQDRK